nr:response regulator transcription factor [Aliiruegeria lutimaris]
MPLLKALVIDDEVSVRSLLRNCLETDGFSVLEAATENEALDIAARTDLSVITLDLYLAEGDGLSIARRIRGRSNVPIIMVTGRDDPIDRVVGLELGADDYITKPFHVREFLARVHSVLRRSLPSQPQSELSTGDAANGGAMQFDGLTLLLDQFELIGRQGERCGLTTADFTLLMVFLENPKQVLSREQLLKKVAGLEWEPTDRSIDNRVARLRKKIERDPDHPQLIKTVRGIGYLFAWATASLVNMSDLDLNT